MKLQISGQQWRLRVSEDELQCLREGDSVISKTSLPSGATFSFVLKLNDVSLPSVRAEGDNWSFVVPAALVDDYVQRLPCREGLDFSLPVTGDVTLELAFEVDVRDSVRRRGAGSRRP